MIITQVKKLENFLKRNFYLILFSGIYLLTFLYMLPLYDETFQDDWAYIQSAINSYQTGVLHVSNWLGPSTIFQIFWSGLFFKVFGASPKITHLSTIVLLYLGLISFYFLLKRFGLKDFRVFIFTTLLLGFPWVFQFSYTFLSEVPYLSLVLLSLFFLTKGFQDGKSWALFVGSLFAGLVYLTRQIGIAVSMGVLLTLAYQSFSYRRLLLKEALFALLPFAIIASIYIFWLKIPGNLTLAQYHLDYFLKNAFLPYILVIDLGRSQTTFGYQITILERILFYFFNAIGFLLPVFLIFQPRISQIKKLFMMSRKSIFVGTLIFTFLLILNIYYHYPAKTFVIEKPSLVTAYYNISHLDWNYWWKYFVFFSVPLWIVIFSSLLGRASSHILRYDTKFKWKVFRGVFLTWLGALVIYQIAIFEAMFRPRIPMALRETFIPKWLIYKDSIFSPDGASAFYYSWLAIFVPCFLVLALIYIFYRYKPSCKPVKPELAIFGLTFFIQASLVIILGYFSWEQYTTSLIMYFFILLALFTKNWQISPARAIIISLAFLTVSVGATKSRYFGLGIKWRLANNLVQQGIEPNRIYYPDESWMPWWYYEKYFDTAVAKNFKGNKYNITMGQTAIWRPYAGIAPSEEYDVIETTKPNTPAHALLPAGKVLLFDTGPIYYDIFSKKRYLVVRQPIGSYEK